MKTSWLLLLAELSLLIPYMYMNVKIFNKRKDFSVLTFIKYLFLSVPVVMYIYSGIVTAILLMFGVPSSFLSSAGYFLPIIIEFIVSEIYARNGENNKHAIIRYTHLLFFALSQNISLLETNIWVAICFTARATIAINIFIFKFLIPTIQKLADKDLTSKYIHSLPMLILGIIVIICFINSILYAKYPILMKDYTYTLSMLVINLISDIAIIVSFLLSAQNVFDIDKITRQKSSLQEQYNNLNKLAEEKEELMEQMIQALVKTIEAKDEYTEGHSSRVAEYSLMIAKKYGKDEKYLDKLKICALLHDIGKIAIPDAIINKTSKLDDDEWAQMQAHPQRGADILKVINSDPELVYGALYHHEKYNGTGYPSRKKGDDIPEIARIIAVADAYDAMTSKRSYRTTMPQSEVREEFVKNLGIQFDPTFGQIMLNIIDEDKKYELHA